MLRICWICAFVLGILVVIIVWPFFQNLWSGSYSGSNAGYNGYDNGWGGYNNSYGGYNSGYGGYNNGYGYNGSGGYGGGYGGYGGGANYGTWGQPTYAISAPPRPRIAPPPCYSPCY
jgi:hypothetical protein